MYLMTKYMRIQSVPINYKIAGHSEGTGAGVTIGMRGAHASAGYKTGQAGW